MSDTKRTIAIIGAGILGMTLALRLSKRGYKITIFDAAPEVGGLAASWQIGDFIWDKFYHVILMSDLHTRGLLKELGLEQDMQWVETKTGFYTDGKLYSMSNSIEFLRFPPLNLIDKFRLGMTIMTASRITDWKKLEYILVEDWLRKWSGNNTFEKIWRPLLLAKLGESYKETSAAFIWTTIQRMYAARRSGMKKEMFGYLPGGYGRILNVLKSKLEQEGIVIKTAVPISSANTDSDHMFHITYSANNIDKFDKVIYTIPAPFISRSFESLTVREKHTLEQVRYLGVICASLVLKKSLSPYYVTNLTETELPFTGIIEMSALVDKSEFKGGHLVYLPKYILSDDPMFEKTDLEIIDTFVSYLKKVHPQLTDDDILDIKVARAKHVFALPTINYSEQAPTMETSIPGLYVVNSSQIVNGTLNVNETIQLAERAIHQHF